MGISSSKTKSSTTTTPTPPSWIRTPYQNYATRVQGMFDTPYVQPFNAQERAAYNFRGTPLNAANSVSSDLTGYQGGTIAGTDLSQYLNPFTENVIDNSMRDLNRGRQMQITGDQARATAAGAFGGSRHGVADSLTNREFADSAGNLASNLRMQGFTNAQDMAQRDIGNNLNSANLRLNAQNSLFGNRLSAASNARADAGALATLGEQQRRRLALQDNSSPEYMAMMAQLLQGMNGPMFTGQQSNSTQSGGGLGGLLGGLGSLGMGLGGLGWQPFGRS